MAKSYEEWLKEIKAQNETALNQKITQYNNVIDQEIANQNQIYNDKISQTKNDYESLYDLNEVQKIVNQKAIAEKISNIGLKDSGLNRTQQTAVQLSYSNNKSELESKEQMAITSLKTQLAQYVSQALGKKSDNEIKVREEYAANAQKQAKELYEAELKAETERMELEKDAKIAAEKAAEKANSTSTSKRKEAIKYLKENFKDIYNNYKGNYSAKKLSTVFGELAQAEKEYGLSAFECIGILSKANIEYDDYVEWKNKKTSYDNEDEKKFIAGVNYDPIWLRKDYIKYVR